MLDARIAAELRNEIEAISLRGTDPIELVNWRIDAILKVLNKFGLTNINEDKE